MNWEMISAFIAILWLIYMTRRSFKIDAKAELQDIRADIKETKRDMAIGFNDNKADLVDIKEHLMFIEAAGLYNAPIETVQPNIRSQRAKEMWQRRKQKRLEQKD